MLRTLLDASCRRGNRWRTTTLVCLVLLCVADTNVALAQQRSWHGASEDSLVLRAIARRGQQLADSTLVSFEADAHGFLSFLAQLGEGTLIPPRVVQSEELASRLYWWAPNRRAQRLVGRRDTTLLPASVGYYRDRYQVVLDNLPDLIRLGDGMDVRDIPHPLSPSASTMYEYSRGDVLQIRLHDQVINVDEIRFRPRDASQPAAVGSLFLHRETGAVARLSMSFTRAAIIDRRIETLVLTLENGLINGRYWLPRRQEVEVARKSTWFEIPARGIVRGRWEVKNYIVNEKLTPAVTLLPQWSVAPRDSLLNYPFQGRIVDVLPPDVRMASDEELSTAREQVEEAVRAAALARPARAAIAGAGISDFVRYTRTEGFAAGLGVTRRVGNWQVVANARYGISDEELKGRLAVGRIPGLGGPPVLQLFVEREYRDVMFPERSGVTNSLGALLFSSDYTTQVDTRAAGATWRPSSLSRWQWRLAAEGHAAVNVAVRPFSANQEATVSMWELRGARLDLRYDESWVAGVSGDTRGRSTGVFSLGAYNGEDISGERVRPLMVRAQSLSIVERPLSGDRVFASILGGAAVAGNDIAPQWVVFAGGPWSAPGYRFHEFSSQIMVSQRLEFRQPVRAPSFSLGRYGRTPAHVTIAPYVQVMGIARPIVVARHRQTVGDVLDIDARDRAAGIYPSVGVSVLFFFDLIRADVARGLENGIWTFSIDMDRSFWGIL